MGERVTATITQTPLRGGTGGRGRVRSGALGYAAHCSIPVLHVVPCYYHKRCIRLDNKTTHGVIYVTCPASPYMVPYL